MLECSHGINLLDETFFKHRIFNHFFPREAFDGKECGRGCRFSSQQHMTEPSFSYFSNTVKAIRIQDISGLKLLITF
jgi:hypothetical protein